MPRRIPLRKCVGCNERKAKFDLIRIVYNSAEDTISIDKTGKANGRGAYICPDPACLNKAVKSKNIERSLKKSVSEKIYEDLKKEIDEMIG
ncbi:MAG: YlxR family protein [Halanaerobiaceae bacterium]|nr:YlxR family protein [Halanaerobiaceae bacterium]